MNFKQLSFLLLILLPVFCAAKPIKGYWEGYITHQQQRWLIAAEFETGPRNESVAYVDFIEVGGYRRLFSLTQKNNSIRFQRPQPDGRPSLIFEGTATADSITGTFEGLGIKGAAFTLRPAAKAKAAYTIEEVSFNNDTVKLSGTLFTPSGKGPYPAVVITHGSGPDTRDRYYGIAVHFVKNGVAALIYDKRGNGKSTGGDYTEAGFTDLAKDALAGLALLKTKKQINSRQIGVFGHSQGGWIAPMAATLSQDVAFVITSAASAINATEQSVYHRAGVMRQEGFDEAAIQKAAGLRERLNAATKLCFTDTAKAREEVIKSSIEIAAVKNEPWFAASALPQRISDPGCPTSSVMELLYKQPEEIWEKVKVPVYAVWGDKDFVVPVDKISIITDALKRAGNKNVTTKVIPDVDHSLLVTRSDKTWDFPREPANYFTDMALWVRKVMADS